MQKVLRKRQVLSTVKEIKSIGHRPHTCKLQANLQDLKNRDPQHNSNYLSKRGLVHYTNLNLNNI